MEISSRVFWSVIAGLILWFLLLMYFPAAWAFIAFEAGGCFSFISYGTDLKPAR